MNLFLRLILTFVKARLAAGSTDYLAPHTLKFRVLLTDQDVFNHMNNSRYLSMMDLAVVDWLIRSGVWAPIRAKGWFPVTVFKELINVKQMRFPDKFELRSQVAGWSGPYICLTHEFIRAGQLVAVGKSIGRVVGPKGVKPTADDIVALAKLDTTERPSLGEDFMDRITSVERAQEHANRSFPDS